jgi:AcrR family transcriptional regulator
VGSAGVSSGRRQYRSPLRARRAQETSESVLDAATHLFTTRGWAATGMRDIAVAAGVATETLYSHFGSKRALLQRVVDVAVVGDAEPVPVAERPEFAALAQGTPAERFAATARLVAGINARTARFARLLREAAPVDDGIAEMLAATRERHRQDTEAAAALLLGRAPGTRLRDELWALTSPEVHHLLVEVSGWEPDEYEAWLADALRRLVPAEEEAAS